MTFNRKLLETNIKLNNADKIKIYPFALGDQNKEQEFYIYDSINWSSFNKNENIVSTEIVKTITIGRIPTVLRMDVEG